MVAKSGSVSYQVCLHDGNKRHYHVEQMHNRTVEESQELDTPDVDTDSVPQVGDPNMLSIPLVQPLHRTQIKIS